MEALLNEEMLEETPELEGFVIDNDDKADWALRKIRQHQAERDRRVAACMSVVNQYKAKAEAEERKANADIDHLQWMLRNYFDTVEHKKTKTTESYWLPTGKLKMKMESCKMVPDNEKLMEAYPDYVKRDPELKWGELKKRFAIDGGTVIDTSTGEIVDGVSVQTIPASFGVEV